MARLMILVVRAFQTAPDARQQVNIPGFPARRADLG